MERLPLENGSDYYPYGKVLRQYVNANGPEKYLSTQHERDQETGLDYRGARYYDSDVARFLSLDPAQAEYPSWSPYNYVMGNPISLIDPEGRSANCPDPPCGENDAIKGQLQGAWNFLFGDGSTTQQKMEAVLPDKLGTLALKGMEYTPQGKSMGLQVDLSGWGANEWGEAAQEAIGLGASFAIGASARTANATMRTTSTMERVFWSGQDIAQDAATSFARANGLMTLEMTFTGRALTGMTEMTSKSLTRPLWNMASARFARGAEGTVNVFHNATEGVSLRSTWRNVEYPLLKGRTNLVYHPVFR